MTKVLFELETSLVRAIGDHVQKHRTFKSRTEFYQNAIRDYASRCGVMCGGDCEREDGQVYEVQRDGNES